MNSKEFIRLKLTEIYVEKLGGGWLQLSTIVNGQRYKQKYMSVPIKEAKRHFSYNYDKCYPKF